ncbi:polysaccharide biosynthesis protein [Desulfallas sp. Bu1-1]|uniref:putative polysaccharide biosynthesis protein n=1 Tax=Desulfallas sp. Bu1-1 TaxID=2787620 RepID=UPI00189ED0FE|nr:polysaccharide biosynthesis protein [Desulfallas sp. Bu1-1]MBF7082471.1 polysaccharide biosynthesis protein [Desulfallas sp. Bu1-1]
MSRVSINKQTVLQGTLILTITWLVIRILGAVYRVPLGRMLGDVGLGIYAVPNQFYMLFYTISSAGIPVALAGIVSEKMAVGHYRDALRVFRLTRTVMILVGLVFSLTLFASAGWLIESGLVPNPDAYLGLRAISPVIFFAAVTSAYRGLFQGFQNMRAVAYSQIADQVMMVAATILFSYLLLPQGLAVAAAGANLGAVPGAAAATLLLVFLYRGQRRDLLALAEQDVSGAREGTLSLLKRIFKTSVPVSIASIAITVTAIIDHKLIVDRLQLVGYTQQQAIAQFGQFNQMAMSFVTITTALAQSLRSSLVPSVAECLAVQNLQRIRHQVSQAVRLVIIFTLPAAAGLYILAHQLTLLVFAEEAAGVPLASLSAAVLFWSVHLVTSGALQGMGRAAIPVRNLVTGIIIKIAITYYYTPTSLGIRAAALGTVVIFVVSSLLNILSIARLVGFNFNFNETLLRSALSTIAMSAGVLAVYHEAVQHIGGNTWPTLLAVLAGMIIYPVFQVALYGVRAGDVRRLPGVGSRLALILEKIGRK